MVLEKAHYDACIKGNQKAFNLLYKMLFSFLMNICVRYKKNQDESGASLNAIFLRVVENLDKFEREKPFLPWVKTIAINLLTDEYRKSEILKNRMTFNQDLRAFENNHTIDFPIHELEAKDLLEMIRELPELPQKVFNLYAIDGFNHREIGDLLEMSEGTSKWHLHQARNILQKLIANDKIRTQIVYCEKRKQNR